MRRRTGGKRAWRADDVFRSLKGDDGDGVASIQAGMRTWIAMMRGHKKPKREEA